MTKCYSTKRKELIFNDEDGILSTKIKMVIKDLKYVCNNNFFDVSYINKDKNIHIHPFFISEEGILDFDKQEGVIVAKNELTETILDIITDYENKIVSYKNIRFNNDSMLVFCNEYSNNLSFLEIVIGFSTFDIGKNQYYKINCDFNFVENELNCNLNIVENEKFKYLLNIYNDFGNNINFIVKKNNLTDTMLKYLLMEKNELAPFCGSTTTQSYKENILYFFKELSNFDNQDFSNFSESYVKELYIKKIMNFLADLWD